MGNKPKIYINSIISTAEGITKHIRETSIELLKRKYDILLEDNNLHSGLNPIMKQMYTPIIWDRDKVVTICNNPPIRPNNPVHSLWGCNHKPNLLYYLAFEACLPKDWVYAINESNAQIVLTPSSYCKGKFIESGVTKPIQVLPHGFNPDIYFPKRKQPAKQLKNKKLKFLFAGTIHQCLTPDTKILLANLKYQNLDNIQIGEEIITHTGKNKKVIGKFEKTINKDIIKITTNGYGKIKGTKEHKLLVMPYEKALEKKKWSNKRNKYIQCYKQIFNENDLIWKEMNNIKKGDFLVFPKKLKVPINNSIPELTENEAWLFGFMLAEGNIKNTKWKNKKYKAGITVSQKFNTVYYNKLINILNESNIPFSEYKGKTLVSEIYIKTNNNIVDKFKQLFNMKPCAEKAINDIVFSYSKPILEKIIEGYINGDGHIRKNKHSNEYIFSTMSPELGRDLFTICQILNKKSNIRLVKLDNKKILTVINFSNSNKQQKKISKNYLYICVEKTKAINYKGKIIDLEIEDDHSFIANNIISHNSRKGLEYLINAWNKFKYKDKCELILKTNLIYGVDPSLQKQIRKLLKEDKNVTLITDTLNEKDMGQLFNDADCYISPSHSEGFGIMILENIACGTPCLITGWTGEKDFTQDIDSVLTIKPSKELLMLDFFPYKDQTWHTPDERHFLDQMEYIYNNIKDLQKKAKVNAKKVKKTHTWEKIVNRYEKIIGDLMNEK